MCPSTRRRAGSTVALTLFAALALLIVAPLALGARSRGAHFKVLRWVVSVPDSTNYVRAHNVKPGGRYTLCNMDRLSELQIRYSYKNALTRGLPYTLTISGPGGSEKARFHAAHAGGTGSSGWSAGSLPPMFTQPTEAGVYTVTITHGSTRLMKASIDLLSSNTCS